MKIIKVTRWYLNHGGVDPMLKGKQYVYGVLTSRDEWDVLLTPRGQRFFERAKAAGSGIDHQNWMLDSNDEWTEVPMDEWPEEVCVEVARMTLLGEDQNEEND
jgi:hypothetical protein